MGRRILVVCSAPPAWGEAPPWAYGLYECLRNHGFAATLVILLTEADVAFFQYLFGADFEDPHQLGGVMRCLLNEPIVRRQENLQEMIAALAPELLVAWGITAARLVRLAAPDLALVFMASRCDELEQLVETGAVRDFVGFRSAVNAGVRFAPRPASRERDAVEGANLIVVPSDLARFVFGHLYPDRAGKMHAHPLPSADFAYCEAERFADLRRPFSERDIDAVFFAPEWHARARNLPLAEDVCARWPHRNIHVVGEIAVTSRAHTHGVPRQRRALFEILGRSKVAVFPGLADAGPGGMLTASAMDCNLVAAPGCGYAELCHPDLRLPTWSVATACERIEPALVRPFADNRNRFLGGSPQLVETLAVF